jgi:transcriptional regulator with XRE-family HTH domain
MAMQYYDSTKQIGRAMAVLAALCGDSQRDLATITRMSESTITRRMSGLGQWTADDLRAVASAYDVPLQVLLLDPAEIRSAIIEAAANVDSDAFRRCFPPEPVVQMALDFGTIDLRDQPAHYDDVKFAHYTMAA